MPSARAAVRDRRKPCSAGEIPPADHGHPERRAAAGAGAVLRPIHQNATLNTWTIGLTVTQTLFNGFKTANTVRQSEAQVRAGREALRNTGGRAARRGDRLYQRAGEQSLVEAQRVDVTFLGGTLDTTRKAARCRRRHADRRGAVGRRD
jgi:hypothetical protein